MISVKEAQRLILEHTDSLGTEVVPIEQSLGGALAEDVFPALDLPPFNQSAMDGYAIVLNGRNTYEVIGEVKAGDNPEIAPGTGKALRIFTGALVPKGTDAVVIQEKVQCNGTRIKVLDEDLKLGSNIRQKGDQLKSGELALSKGTRLSAAGVSFLACLGLQEVSIYKKPKVAIAVTGNELVKPGRQLEKGQIYESNSYALAGALKSEAVSEVNIFKVKDDLKKTANAIREALSNSDIVLISGGISVGDYDFVRAALMEIGMQQQFYKVAQKPGKPIFFGTQNSKNGSGKKLIFALPGNPASALVCFYEYVIPSIRKTACQQDLFLEKKVMRITHRLHSKGDRTCFFRGKTEGDQVKSLEGQASFIMKSFALANCLIAVPPEVNDIAEGEEVEVHCLPV